MCRPSPTWPEMLVQRVLTAVILLAVLVGAILWSPDAFEAVATVVVAIALGEWLQLIGWPRKVAVIAAIVFCVLLFIVTRVAPDLDERVVMPLALLATIVWLSLVVLLLQANAMSIRLPRVVATLLALLLTGAAWVALAHFVDEGVPMLLSVLVLVWIADTAAYFFGKAFGKRKLAPHISPGKTWAGVFGAVFAVIALALLAQRLWPSGDFLSNRLVAHYGFGAALLLAALVVVSIAGDLFESLLKRQAGVKDSSHLLPGHGGVYDRVDALLPVLPLAALFEWMAR